MSDEANYLHFYQRPSAKTGDIAVCGHVRTGPSAAGATLHPECRSIMVSLGIEVPQDIRADTPVYDALPRRVRLEPAETWADRDPALTQVLWGLDGVSWTETTIEDWLDVPELAAQCRTAREMVKPGTPGWLLIAEQAEDAFEDHQDEYGSVEEWAASVLSDAGAWGHVTSGSKGPLSWSGWCNYDLAYAALLLVTHTDGRVAVLTFASN